MHSNMIPNTDLGIGPGFQFGFSDELQQNIPLFRDEYPITEGGLLLKIDVEMKSANDNGFYNNLLSAYKKHDNNYALIVIDEFEKYALQSQINKLQSAVGKALQYNTFEVIDGKTAVFVYRWGLFG